MHPGPPDLEQQLQRHGGALRRLAGELVRDAAAADDAVQETWLHAVRRRPQPDGPFVAWLVTVLRRAAQRTQRGERRRQRREQLVARELVVADHVEVVARTEITQRLLAAVNALDAPYRETIWRRYFEDLPPRAIAQRDGVPLATVKSRLQRGLQQLRARLGEGGESDWRSALAGAFGFSKGAAAAATVAVWQGGVLMATWMKGLVAVAAAAFAVWWCWPTSVHTMPVAANEATVAAEVTAAVGPQLPSTRVDVQPTAAAAVAPPPAVPTAPAAPVGVGGVRGRVVDAATHEPLAGVVVMLTAGKVDADGPNPVVTTAADGRFGFDVRGGTRWGLRGRRADRTTSGGSGDAFVDHVEELGDLEMRPGRTVRGRLVDEGGAAIPPKTLVIAEPYGSAHTEMAGAFTIEEPLPIGTTRWSVPYGPFELAGPRDIEIGEREPELLVLRVRHRASITGVVVDDRGQPVAGVRLAEQPGPGTVAVAADGTFTVWRMRPGGAELATIFVPETPGCDPHAPIENVPWGTDNLRIELRRTQPFAIEVVDESGAPVESFGLSIDRPRDVFTRAKVVQRGPHPGGKLMVDDVVRGATRLRVLPGDPALAPSDLLPVGDVEPLRFVIERRRELPVRVQRGGDGVAGVEVCLVRERGKPPASLPSLDQIPDPSTAEQLFSWIDTIEGIASGTTDAAGRVTLLADRDLRGCALYLRPAGGSPRAVRHFVRPQDGGELAVELPGAASLHGRVALGTFDYRNVRVEIPQAGKVGGFAIQLPPDGTFTTELQAGEYRIDVQVLDESACTVASRTVVVGDEPVHVDFDLGGLAKGAAHGTVTADVPLPPDLELVLLRQTDDGSVQAITGAKPTANGAFAASGLLPGTYQVGFRRGGATAIPAVQRATFAVLGGADVALTVRYTPRRLTVRMVRPDGSTVRSQRVLLGCAGATFPTFTMFAPMVDEALVLDPAPELPVAFRDWTPGSPWSEAVTMPPDRAEAEVTVVLPDAPR